MRSLLRLLPFVFILFIACKEADKSPIPTQPVDTTTNPPVDTTRFATTTTDLVFYEVNMRAQGTQRRFNTFTAQLDSIQKLGCNTIWFMPLHPVGVLRSVGQLGSPYSIRNYTDVAAEYGTLAEFKTLVEQAHTRKLNVVLDWVANHTAWDHPWVTAHPGWYTQNAAGEIVIPAGTNWQDVADLNFSNPAMRLEMIRSMKFWITEMDIDGFRCDAANFIPTDFWKQALDSLKAIPRERPLIFLAEGDRSDQATAGFQMAYGWDFYAKLKTVFAGTQSTGVLVASNNSEFGGNFRGMQRLRFTTNHDETAWENTPITLFGGTAGALAASVITINMGGIPLIYNGQEVGSVARTPLFTTSTLNWTTNPDMKAAYRALLHTRNKTVALRTGTFRYHNALDVVAFTRTTGTQVAFVVVNIRNRAVTYSIPTEHQGHTWKNLAGMDEILPERLDLPAFSYKVLVKK